MPMRYGQHFAARIFICICLNGKFWITHEILLTYVIDSDIKASQGPWCHMALLGHSKVNEKRQFHHQAVWILSGNMNIKHVSQRHCGLWCKNAKIVSFVVLVQLWVMSANALSPSVESLYYTVEQATNLSCCLSTSYMQAKYIHIHRSSSNMQVLLRLCMSMTNLICIISHSLVSGKI